jgi:hypothetical protein
MIDEFDDDVRTYLSAVGALAVYVAEQDSIPVRVGFCHDPQKVLTYSARKWPRVRFGWMAWFEDQQPAAASFVAEIQENAKELIFGRREDNVTTPRRLPWVIAHIENLAKMEMVTLTPHASAVERARAYARRLDAALSGLQQTGEFASFNRAYRIYRERQRMRGESAMPYWAAKEDLRRVIIRWLVHHQRIDPAALLVEIRQRFPWFKAHARSV